MNSWKGLVPSWTLVQNIIPKLNIVGYLLSFHKTKLQVSHNCLTGYHNVCIGKETASTRNTPVAVLHYNNILCPQSCLYLKYILGVKLV